MSSTYWTPEGEVDLISPGRKMCVKFRYEDEESFRMTIVDLENNKVYKTPVFYIEKEDGLDEKAI